MDKRTVISLVIFALLIGGWYYVHKYTKLLSKVNEYYGYYDNIKGLQESNPVYIKGVKVGKVSSIDINQDGRVKVEFAINRTTQIPTGTVAVIANGDLMGGKSVVLRLGPGPGYLAAASTLPTDTDTSTAENFHAKLSPIIYDAKFMLRSADTGFNDFRLLMEGGLGNRTRKDVAEFEINTDKWVRTSQSAAKSVNSLGQTVTKLDSATSNPSQKNADMNNSMKGADKNAGDLSQKDIPGKLNNIGNSLNNLSGSIRDLRASTRGLGKHLNDKSAYEGTTKSIDTLNMSLKETYDDPRGLTIFGGKKKKKEKK
jgi:phospholipid/cholesterol/gamma-HCH transport system substrate-binding protein